jgi:hypothetical protein
LTPYALRQSEAKRRRPPRLLVALALERDARLWLVADDYEDERRLLLWLAGSGALERAAEDLLLLAEQLREQEAV